MIAGIMIGVLVSSLFWYWLTDKNDREWYNLCNKINEEWLEDCKNLINEAFDKAGDTDGNS